MKQNLNFNAHNYSNFRTLSDEISGGVSFYFHITAKGVLGIS